MGILDYDIELAKQAIKRTPGLLNEYLGRLNSTLQDKFAINEMDQKRSMRGLDAMAGGDLKVSKQKLDNAIAQKMVNVGLDMNPGAVGQIVWHGSPHKFNRFDMSKIGTGEGAQAYGHGLYTAESKGVGEEYRKALSDWSPKSEVIKPGSNEEQAMAWLAEALDSQSSNPYFHAAKNAKQSLPKEQFDEVEKILGRWEGQKAEFDKGYLYKVDIPDEAVARFLDWDKPLSQQAPEVQAALQKAAELRSRQTGGAFGPLDMSQLGKDLIPTMGEGRLNKAGIPGIRYLDGGSRGAGQGSSNFVLFDDQMPRILEINGQATGLQPWAKGEWRGLLGE